MTVYMYYVMMHQEITSQLVKQLPFCKMHIIDQKGAKLVDAFFYTDVYYLSVIAKSAFTIVVFHEIMQKKEIRKMSPRSSSHFMGADKQINSPLKPLLKSSTIWAVIPFINCHCDSAVDPVVGFI